ncbi:hypothetical protein VW29_01000 [Devosia limi DSM 17137]|uniref:Uncharacterized protein n=1 Tax=Devosia limi DSM 17137 TaxID=1121477 RepID=A0A0F5LWJ5_9HYPH|nr:hypothetical protein [Devosia limi]KKB86703.1 hypothetical protein VW29_01000 [Devosia limi DSM 17137]SHE84634.1 hypothetical protein SAMN02745223_01206 [Devosia limi DSM 17137]
MKLPLLVVATSLLLAGGPSAAAPLKLAEIATTCLASPLTDCTVQTAGFINADYADLPSRLAWQTQAGISATDGSVGGFVLFQNIDGEWTVLDSAFDAAVFLLPRQANWGLLHIPGYTAGTGSFNADRLYQQGETGWTAIDLDSWQSAIGPLLPKGLEIWKGVAYDFTSFYDDLNAHTALWASDDANCCPTGGDAVIHFVIEDGALVATKLDYTASRTE